MAFRRGEGGREFGRMRRNAATLRKRIPTEDRNGRTARAVNWLVAGRFNRSMAAVRSGRAQCSLSAHIKSPAGQHKPEVRNWQMGDDDEAKTAQHTDNSVMVIAALQVIFHCDVLNARPTFSIAEDIPLRSLAIHLHEIDGSSEPVYGLGEAGLLDIPVQVVPRRGTDRLARDDFEVHPRRCRSDGAWERDKRALLGLVPKIWLKSGVRLIGMNLGVRKCRPGGRGKHANVGPDIQHTLNVGCFSYHIESIAIVEEQLDEGRVLTTLIRIQQVDRPSVQ